VIVDRLERRFDAGDGNVQADTLLYNSLLNAFGWSSVKGKSKKCYSIFQRMLEHSKGNQNTMVKPDIITANSVLNAAAFEEVDSDPERDEIMTIVVRTLEHFQRHAPKYGWPNHVTYCNTLQAIERHVVDPKKRADLAETTFWQCCQNGQVSVRVIVNLQRSLTPWKRFAEILEDALSSKEHEPLHFNFNRLPEEWRRFQPKSKDKKYSRPSQKRSAYGSARSKPSTLRFG
jgi:hypothetical protein